MTRRFDRKLIAVVLALLVLGLVMVQSASGPVASDRMHDSWFYVKRQIFAMIPGMVGCVALAMVPYEALRKYVWAAYGAVILALLLVFVPGISHGANGATRWIGFGSIHLQPSEFAKIVVVLCMAHFLDQHSGRLNDSKRVLLPALLIPVPLLALVLAEPDFGTTVIIGGMAFLTLYVAGLSTRWIYGIAVSGGLAIIPALTFAAYRMERVKSFLDPWADAAGSGYQVIQSLIAFHSGGLLGRGLGESQAKHLFLPEPWTDFVAAVLAEELGLVGIFALLCLYVILVWRGLSIARNAPDLFGTLTASSLTAALGLQAFFNLGVVTGIVPPKGLVLPFMSYGASAIIAHLYCVGILLNISASSGRAKAEPAIYRPALAVEEG